MGPTVTANWGSGFITWLLYRLSNVILLARAMHVSRRKGSRNRLCLLPRTRSRSRSRRLRRGGEEGKRKESVFDISSILIVLRYPTGVALSYCLFFLLFFLSA